MLHEDPAVSDLPFGLTQLDWVVQQAGNYDLVIIAGDLLETSRDTSTSTRRSRSS